MEAYLPLIIQLVAGVIGGTAIGAKIKSMNLGPVGNVITGLIGGGVLGQILQAVLAGSAGADPSSVGAGMDAGAIITDLVGGGAGGAILTGIVGMLKNKLTAA